MYNHDTTTGEERQGLTLKKIRDSLEIAKEKRLSSVRAAELMQKHITEDAYCRMLHCGDVLTMLEDESREVRRLKSAFFCGKRMCPGCMYRGSLVNAVTISAISGALLADGRVSLMVTVTAPNCTGEQLSEEINRYNRAWNHLMKLKRYRVWADHIRKMEVTYNQQADTYHPHIHALVFVSPSYFKGQNYISQDRLLHDWRRCFDCPDITQVDIRKTHGQDWRAISELAKYVAKSSDYLYSQRVFDVFYTALKNKRLSGYSGRCKTLRAEYRAGGLRQYVERDLTRYVWQVIYVDYSRTGCYTEEAIKPYDGLIMGDEDIPIEELLPPDWDKLAD